MVVAFLDHDPKKACRELPLAYRGEQGCEIPSYSPLATSLTWW